MRRHLVIFARAPALGGGKRRLARQIGDVATLGFERSMLSLLFRRLGRDRRWKLRLAVTPAGARRRFARVAAFAQGRGDLGGRMRRAIDACPPGPVVLIGADIPALRAAHIATAFRLLGARDLVFGPATDGGFWLVGGRRRPLPPSLFKQVRWSSRHALADTLAHLPPTLKIGFADTLEDVDAAASYCRLKPRRGF